MENRAVAEPTTEPAEGAQAAPGPLKAGSCVLVIFGGTGDLAKRMLIPALYHLSKTHQLADEFAMVGLSNDDLSEDAYKEKIREYLRTFAGCGADGGQGADGSSTGAPSGKDDPSCEWLVSRAHYLQGDFRDPETYRRLQKLLQQVDQEAHAQGRFLYYLATFPEFFRDIVQQLAAVGLTTENEGAWRRVVIEKPYGSDLDSARALNTEMRKVLEEHQIYRIDHYLGKETVQNILVFRFSNGIFEPIWNRRYVDHVQITVAETLGVEGRGGYYEHAGALRDMMPNHLFQLMALTAMEPPISFEPGAVRTEKVKILRAIQPMSPEEVLTRTVRGQYGAGAIQGRPVPGYRSEHNVSPRSTRETFAAIKLFIDNWRWADVPFYLRTGKRMHAQESEIVIQFRRVPFLLFQETPVDSLTPNSLVLHLQPVEGMSLQFGAKIPGPAVKVGPVAMDFRYTDYFGMPPRTGYETMLHDCMIGDATLFKCFEEVEASWSIVTPVLDIWEAVSPRSFPNYEAGSWGPAESLELLRRDRRFWRASAGE